MELHFTKMHGLGNDYIYVNCLKSEVPDPEEVARRVSDRHFGIGADGLVLILPSGQSDFRMRMFNADGSESQMCGNAVRCIAKYLFERGLTSKTQITLETKAGEKTLNLDVQRGVVESVRVDLGEPILDPHLIPVVAVTNPVIHLPIQIEQELLYGTCVSIGNPHVVFFVDEITDHHVLTLGPLIERHALFPERVNVEFVKVLAADEVRMRVWERGSGETLACGTGAAAVCVAGVLTQRTNRKVQVHLTGGDLDLYWAVDNHVYKTGSATFVFDGCMNL